MVKLLWRLSQREPKCNCVEQDEWCRNYCSTKGEQSIWRKSIWEREGKDIQEKPQPKVTVAMIHTLNFDAFLKVSLMLKILFLYQLAGWNHMVKLITFKETIKNLLFQRSWMIKLVQYVWFNNNNNNNNKMYQ